MKEQTKLSIGEYRSQEDAEAAIPDVVAMVKRAIDYKEAHGEWPDWFAEHLVVDKQRQGLRRL